MLNPTYLTLSRHNVFYFRWPLPKNLRQAGKTTHLKFSLRTREPKQALRLANALEYHMRTLFHQGYGVGMNFSEIKEKVEEYFHFVLEMQKEKIDQNGPLSADEIKDWQYMLAINTDLQAYHRAREELNVAIPQHPDIRLKPLRELTGIPLDRNSEKYKLLSELYRHGAIACAQATLNYSQQQTRFSFSSDNQPVSDFMPDGPQTNDGLSFIINKFSTEMLTAKLWGIKATNERADCYEVLTDILGANTSLKSITVADARNIKEMLMQLPKNRKKMKETRGLSIAEQVKIQGIEVLSVTSINKYLRCYSSLFSWAIQNGYIEKNPFNGMALKSGTKQRRDQFSADQIKAMLADLKARKSQNKVADHAYWGTLIGIYTGARLNEIASLTPDDVCEENGIWYFDINDQDEMKRLKTSAAKRRVPIHSALLTSGFLAYVQSVKLQNKPETRLLHTLTYSEKEGWGRNLGRWFNTTFLKSLEIKKPGLSFHSLRHTAITTMRRASIERPIVQAIVGHEPDGVTEEVYTHGYELSQLQAAIEAIRP